MPGGIRESEGDGMNTSVQDLLRRLAHVAPQEVPEGEPGVRVLGAPEAPRAFAPVLSVYLDLRPQAHGERPAVRASRVLLKERLHQIAQTFWPRGMAYDAVRADAARIERFLDTRVSPASQGVAIFASTPLTLFEALEVEVPFDTQVSAGATPDLFQLARLLDDQETAVVAVVNIHMARLFVTHRGGLREIRGLADDPKFYHMVHGTNAMNQAHYQRHARSVRGQFAAEVAERIEQLVAREQPTHVVLAGEAPAIALLRQALAPHIARLVHEPPLTLDIDATGDEILEEVAPLLRAAEAEQDRAVVDQLVEAVRADRLGVAGVQATRRALANGQADVLVLAADVPLPRETRSELIGLAANTDAAIEVVDESPALRQMEGVGALLRYRVGASPTAREAPPPVGAAPTR
jgi:hypothetical protein